LYFCLSFSLLPKPQYKPIILNPLLLSIIGRDSYVHYKCLSFPGTFSRNHFKQLFQIYFKAIKKNLLFMSLKMTFRVITIQFSRLLVIFITSSSIIFKINLSFILWTGFWKKFSSVCHRNYALNLNYWIEVEEDREKEVSKNVFVSNLFKIKAFLQEVKRK
jgi:hypothetical protein